MAFNKVVAPETGEADSYPMPDGYMVLDSGLVPVDPKKRNKLACYGPDDNPPPRPEIERAKKGLSAGWVPSKRGNYGSYGMKHVMENETGEYVSNGAFIQAALELGFPVKPDGSQINALICARSNRWRCEGGL